MWSQSLTQASDTCPAQHVDVDPSRHHVREAPRQDHDAAPAEHVGWKLRSRRQEGLPLAPCACNVLPALRPRCLAASPCARRHAGNAANLGAGRRQDTLHTTAGPCVCWHRDTSGKPHLRMRSPCFTKSNLLLRSPGKSIVCGPAASTAALKLCHSEEASPCRRSRSRCSASRRAPSSARSRSAGCCPDCCCSSCMGRTVERHSVEASRGRRG